MSDRPYISGDILQVVCQGHTFIGICRRNSNTRTMYVVNDQEKVAAPLRQCQSVEYIGHEQPDTAQIQTMIEDQIAAGRMIESAPGQFRLTPEGERYAERMIATDPEAKEALRRLEENGGNDNKDYQQ